MACEACTIFADEQDLCAFLSHLRAQHRHAQPLQGIRCIVKECPLALSSFSFKSFGSYYGHCMRKHKPQPSSSGINMGDNDHRTNESQQEGNTDHRTNESPDAIRATQDNEQERNRPSTSICMPTSSATAASKLPMAVYKLRILHNVSQAATKNLVTDVQASISSLHSDVATELENVFGKDVSTKDLLDSCKLSISKVFSKCIEDLDAVKTGYSQDRYFASIIGYVKPSEITLGTTLSFTGVGVKRKASTKPHCMYYVSIAETLKSLASDITFHDLLQKSGDLSSSGDRILGGFEDGLLHCTHPIMKRDDCIPLILYYDDIEICNPLGSYTKVHQLAMFYFTLADIPMKYRSRLQSIFLLGIAYSTDVKKYGIDEVLRPFYQEMEVLSKHGVTLPFPEGEKLLKCCLAVVSADTPAANLLAGFKEGVGFAYRKCRHCMATSTTMSEFTLEEEFELRTSEMHETQSSGGTWTSIESGVNRRSALMDVPYFDLFKCVPHDVMHILFEGVIPYTLKQVLNHLMGIKKFFSLDQLNYQINHYPYSNDDKKDKPSPISKHQLAALGTLRQSSSQMWCFMRLLPLMLERYIDTNDRAWQCMILLMEVTAIIMSPRIPFSKISYLKQQIALYLTEFKLCFKDVTIIPKQHYLVSSPSNSNTAPWSVSWILVHEI